MSLWNAPAVDGPVNAFVALPGSKSITNRALILAALADGDSTITGALRSRDTDLMIDALRQLGTTIEAVAEDPGPGSPGDKLTVRPGPLRGATIDCGLAGTVMRFLPPLSVLAEGNVSFDGDAQARVRPLGVILDAMRLLGAQVAGNALPFTVFGTGALEGGVVDVDASGSSQFVSGLLLSGARYRHGLTVRHRGKPVPSMPHIDMTIEMLEEAGVTVTAEHEGPGAATWTVAPGPIRAVDWVIEPDLSNATPFLAAAAVTGGRVSVPHWPAHTTQAGNAIRAILEEMGCEVSWADQTLTVQGPARLQGIDIDLRAMGELAPTVAAIAVLAQTPSRLRGIEHLRGHETDRLAALTAEINALGGAAVETPDGIEITPATLTGGTWHSYADHRMATAGAIIGLRVPGVVVEDIGTTGKTLPNFPAMWSSMLGANAQTATANVGADS